jgi:hypothetical protein
VVEFDDLGGDVEVPVVVDDRETVLCGQDRGEQVGDADGSVSTGAGQFPLRGEGPLPLLVAGRQYS